MNVLAGMAESEGVEWWALDAGRWAKVRIGPSGLASLMAGFARMAGLSSVVR